MKAEQKERSIFVSKRLSEAIDYALTKDTILIEAPTGYGKTMAARELEKRAALPVKWVNTYDRNINHAWTNFCRVVFSDRSVVENLVRWPFPEEGLQRTMFADCFEEVLERHGRMMIVFDDYQELRSKQTNVFLGYLAREFSDNLQLVIISQRTVFLGEEELVSSGKLFRIDNDLLRLTREELDAYIARRHIDIPRESVDELYDSSEGWFAMIIAALSGFTTGKRTDFGVDMEHLVDRRVYSTLPAHIRYFLSFVAPLQDFTKEEADFFNDGEDASEILEWLTDNRSFLDYDGNTGVYHIHSIFQKCLRHRFESMNQGEKIKRYERLAEYSLENKNYNRTIYWYEKAGNFEGVLLTLELYETMCGPDEDIALLSRCFDECPKLLFEDYPFSLILFMWRFYTYGDEVRLGECKTLFQSEIRQIYLSHSDRTFLEKAYCVFSAMSAFNDLDKMQTLVQKASTYPAGEMPVLDPSVPGNFGIPSLAHMFYQGEKPEKLVEKMKGSLSHYNEIGMQGYDGLYRLLEAEFLYYRGEIEQAKMALLEVKRDLMGEIGECFRLNIDYFLAHIALFEGDVGKMKRIVQSLRSTVLEKWRAESALAYAAEMVEALFHLHEGQPEFIAGWILDPDGEIPAGIMNQAYPFAFLVRFNALLRTGRFEEILSTNRAVLRVLQECPYSLTKASILLCFASAAAGIGNKGDARRYIIRAYRLLENGFPVVYALYGEWLMELYQEIVAEQDDETLTKDLAVCKKAAKVLCMKGDDVGEELFSELTKRENEIAALVIEGLTNEEIAERLFISKNTVKSSLKNIFGKLGISSRREMYRMYQTETTDPVLRRDTFG